MTTQYRAYVVPDFPVDGTVDRKRKTLVLRSRFISELLISQVGEGFLVEGKRKNEWNWMNSAMGGAPYRTAQEFFDSVGKAVCDLSFYGFDRNLESFANRNNLQVTRLIAR